MLVASVATGDRRVRDQNTVTVRKNSLSQNEIAHAFEGEMGKRFGPVLNIEEAAALLRRSVKTLYEWTAKGYFKGCFRKRGKRLSFWRDRLVEEYFNGPDWSKEDGQD